MKILHRTRRREDAPPLGSGSGAISLMDRMRRRIIEPDVPAASRIRGPLTEQDRDHAESHQDALRLGQDAFIECVAGIGITSPGIPNQAPYMQF